MRVRGTQFWDRDSDEEGSSIRPDVRKAAITIWPKAQAIARSLLGDADDAPEIFESCVARISQYLDRKQEALFSGRTESLLLLAFRQALQDVAAKRRTLEFIGGAEEFDERLSSVSWQPEIESRLDFEKLLVRLTHNSRTMLLLRYAGYQWSEIALLFGTTPGRSRNRLWRELQKLRSGESSNVTQTASPEPDSSKTITDNLSDFIPPPD